MLLRRKAKRNDKKPTKTDKDRQRHWLCGMLSPDKCPGFSENTDKNQDWKVKSSLSPDKCPGFSKNTDRNQD